MNCDNSEHDNPSFTLIFYFYLIRLTFKNDFDPQHFEDESKDAHFYHK
jgi:hypothetical protein